LSGCDIRIDRREIRRAACDDLLICVRGLILGSKNLWMITQRERLCLLESQSVLRLTKQSLGCAQE
jgi:hypothetical protein